MKKALALVMAMLMVLSLAACGGGTDPTKPSSGTETPEKKVKDTLTVTLASEPTTLNPHAIGQLNAYIVDYLIYDTLLKKDDAGNILPNVATSWDEIDETHIRFHLRDDVTFSNGQKLTAEDVLFTIQQITTSSTTKSTYSQYDGENSYVEDEKTFVLVLKTPFAAVYDFLTHSYSSIVCKSYYEQVGKDEYGINPVGSGAYLIDKWTTGSSILLKRNENYWGQKGASEKINVKFIAEQGNRAMELETGNTDIALDISTTDAARIDENDKLNLETVPSYQVVFITFNQGKEETANPLIRKAIAYATDAATLADVVYGKFGSVADSVMATGVPEYAKQNTYEYDVEKAKQTLAEAGFPNGITLTGRCQTNANFEAISTMVMNMWAKAGINCEINVYDKATYTEKGKENGGTNVTVTAQTATTGNAFQAIGTMFAPGGTNGIVNHQDTVLGDMITKAASTYDLAARKEAYAEAQKYIVENAFVVPVAFTNQIYGVSKNVVDFNASPADIPILTYTFAYAD